MDERMRRREAPSTPLWRRVRRVILIAAFVCLVPVAVSWVRMLSQPRNVSWNIATVEWVRAHGGNPLISQVENWYYELNAPSKGGPPLKSLPHVGVAAVSAHSPEPEEVHIYRPPRVKPLIHPALPGEGVWKPASATAGKRPPVLLTTFRSDPEYPQFVAGVAWIDSGRTHLEYVPGLAEPPALENRGPAEVPPSKRDRIAATFNGGFPLETSNAGLVYHGQVLAPMVNGIATLVEYKGGRIDIRPWENGERINPKIVFAKQNLPPIINEGKLNPNLSDGPEWGATVNNAIRVWRSGLGVDKRGNLIYAAANDQTVESLAKVLQGAGAVRAMELDINEDWTSFITYRYPGAKDPSNLLPEMFRPDTRYLEPDERDFFAVYVKDGKKAKGGH
ncbi:MAG TPA: hypothetical protein VG448_08655 [Solirubrobacterales bacterium]|nr:hypothetical protein [Solirubrobacterales bacterium]